MGTTFSFEEAQGPTADEVKPFVPAARTSKQSDYDSNPFPSKAGKGVKGMLPKDRTIYNSIVAAADKYNVPREAALALAQQESGYNPLAHNAETGADGFFQYIKKTADAIGLGYGTDTRDASKSAEAAMKQFSEQMAIGGVDWAIKHHFAGPNLAGHGPKTAQYLADVTQRMSDIKGLMDSENPAAVAGEAGSSDAGPKQEIGGTWSFEEAQGPAPAKAAAPVEEEEKGFIDSVTDFFKTQATPSGLPKFVKDPMDNSIGKGFAYVRDRILSDTGVYEPDNPNFKPGRDTPDPFGEVRATRNRIEAREEQAREDARPQEKGFFANIENPVKLIMEDSLPSNFVEYLGKTPERVQQKFWDARKTAMQENIVANPDKYPAVSVQEAQAAIDARRAKQDPTIRQMWDHLKQAAKEDPGKFGAGFANALMADPEMALAPAGMGTKVIRGTRMAMTGRAGASQALKIADKMIDAGSTGAAMNLAIEATAAASEGRTMTKEEATFSAAFGFGLSAAAGGVFARGAKSKAKLRNKGPLSEEDLNAAMRDVAQEEILTEEIVNAPKSDIIYDMEGKPMPADTRTRIEQTLGIEKMSPEERKAWHKKRQAEIAKTFKENWSEADYLAAKAQERIDRSEVLAQDAQRKAEAEAAQAAHAAEVDKAFRESIEAKRSRFNYEYDQALAQRDQAREAQLDTIDAHEKTLRETTRKLDEQELIEAAFEGSPQVKAAMQRAVARDQRLNVPKWQRGEIDPKVLTRLGIGSLFAGTAYAVTEDPDAKAGAAFAAGLAGLLIPGGGRVLDRMRQSGVADLDGSIIGDAARLVGEGKLKADVDVGAAKVKELETINRAKQGDQRAYKELYDEHMPRTVRQIRKIIKNVGHRAGVDAEDVAQEVFIDAFKQLDQLPAETPFGAYLYGIAKNKAVDAVRKAQTLKGGADVQTISMYAPMRDGGDSLSSGHILDMEGDAIRGDVEAAAAHLDSPEGQAIRQQTERVLQDAIRTLPERDQLVFLLSRVEQHSGEEIASMMGVSHDAVRQILSRAQAQVEKAIEKGFAAKREAPKVEVANDQPKRGRGRPRKEQTGEIDPRLLKLGGAISLGAAAGAYLNEQNKWLGAGIGAMTGAFLMARNTKGKSLTRQLIEGADYTLGATSTRIKNKSEAIWRRAVEHERIVLRDTHKHMQAVDPFLVKLSKLPKDTRDILSRAILTGKAEVTNRLLQQIGDKDLIDGWKNVRGSLDSLGDQLVALKRFKRGELDYFPRVVKDVDGLLKALGKERGSYLEEALKKAESEAIAERGTGLTDLEKSLVINKVLKEDRWASQQPGFAKNRGVEEITQELQQFYAPPAEALHSYIRSAVEDIQRAKFFGDDLKVIPKGSKVYTDVGKSIGELTNRLMNEGKLSAKDAEEVSGLLRSRFMNGEKSPIGLIQASKNLSYAGLLGNPLSAATQLGDVVMQAYTQDLRSTMQALIRKFSGRKIVSMKDFGLSDHISEEFVSNSRSTKFLNKVFKYSLFKGVDEFGKDIGLNAAIIRYQRLAKSEAGIQTIVRKYGEALGPGEIKQLVTDLQKGEPTDLVRSIAFAELSRSQPITRLELPQAYLDNPNGRLLYQYKTFMLKQLDIARRDGLDELKKGNIARGVRQLTELGVILGISGVATQKVKDYLLHVTTGKDVPDFQASDVAMNMLKTFGLTEYYLDHAFGVTKEEAAQRRADGDKGARKVPAEFLKTTGEMFVPPVDMYDQILRGDPKALRYIPFVGPFLFEDYKARKAKEKEEGNGQ